VSICARVCVFPHLRHFFCDMTVSDDTGSIGPYCSVQATGRLVQELEEMVEGLKVRYDSRRTG
jgi:hypothetical protein